MNKRLLLISIVVCTGYHDIFSQDLLSGLEEEAPKKEFVKNAFKSTRVINAHSLEFVAAGVLDFRILHRFGLINSGAYDAFGFDVARMRLGLDYGISKRLMFGIGRATYKKESDAFLKYRLLWQAKGKGVSPFSIVLVSGITCSGLKFEKPEQKNYFSSRLAYYHQVIIGRKFSERFSFQVAPTLVHNNLVDKITDKNDIYNITSGIRIKLTRRVALTADYIYQLTNQLPDEITQPLSIGFDIETGGHVFQLHFTNAVGMNERVLAMETNGNWDEGDIHFGFNISRVFTIVKRKPGAAKTDVWKEDPK